MAGQGPARRGKVWQGGQRPIFMTQTKLNFDLARKTDPATSQVAAAETAKQLGHLCQVFLTALAGEQTASEVAWFAVVNKLHPNAESVRKRAKELLRLGLIEERPPRRCGVTGKMATTYRRKHDNRRPD